MRKIRALGGEPQLAMTLLLAYPLTVRDLPGRGFYKVLLIVSMGMGQLSFSQYLFV